jgi:acetyltransferase-like isoleucine patch superfamily enzyme
VRKIVIFGASYAGRMMRAYVEREGDQVVAYTVDERLLDTPAFDGLPVYPWERLEQHCPPTAVELLGPVSHYEMNDFRRERHRSAKARGYRLASFIHPSAQIYADHIGEGAVILEFNIIQPGVRIGDGLVSWSGSMIAHDTHIEDYCFLSGSVMIGARCTIGTGSFLSIRSAIKSGITVGERCALLNGPYVGGDLPPLSVVRGHIDRPMRITSNRIHQLL